jgi:hypothetical protein
MQNLKLYEDFNGNENPDFSTLVKQLTEFFEPNRFGSDYKDPSKYFLRNMLFGKSAKAPVDPEKKFIEVLTFITDQKYQFISFPEFKEVSKDFDYKRYFKAIKGLELEFGKSILDSQYAIALPTTHQGKDYYFAIGISDEYTAFRVLKPGESNLLVDRSSNYDSKFEGIIWTDDSLVAGEFILDEHLYHGRSLEDGTSALYHSSKTSNGKRYEIEVGVYMLYKDEIDELEDIVEIKVL